MKKIVFMALHLGVGGVEKAIASEANLLCENFEVHILSAYKLYDEPSFWIDPRVKITYLTDVKPNKEELKKAISSKNPLAILREGIKAVKVLYLRTASMREAVQKTDCDVLISTRYIYNPILKVGAKKKCVTVAQEHNHHNGDEKYIEMITKSLKYTDYFMPVSQELTDFYAERLKNTPIKCKYIPHCLDDVPKAGSPLTDKRILSVGRLSAEKGFADLIDIFSDFHGKHPDWVLDIVGDGDQRQAIEEKIKEYGLGDAVTLHGYQSKEYINELLLRSSVYAMTSLSESFGLVLIEAQSFGLPCIAFDTARGAAEIIADGENGVLISGRDKAAYVKALSDLADSKEERLRLGQAGISNAEKYHPGRVKKEWISFVASVT